MHYDLNIEENIDTFTLNWKIYEIPEITDELKVKIAQINDKWDLISEWRKIVKEILEVRNEINIEDFWEVEILNLIKYFKKKLT